MYKHSKDTENTLYLMDKHSNDTENTLYLTYGHNKETEKTPEMTVNMTEQSYILDRIQCVVCDGDSYCCRCLPGCLYLLG